MYVSTYYIAERYVYFILFFVTIYIDQYIWYGVVNTKKCKQNIK